MDVYKTLSEFYKDEYSDSEIEDMLNDAIIHKTKKFITIAWDAEETMDIFKIVDGQLVFMRIHFSLIIVDPLRIWYTPYQ